MHSFLQASRQWFYKLTEALTDNGYVQSLVDYSLFTNSVGQAFVAALVYVDDILVTGNSASMIHDLKFLLDKLFSIKDLGSVNYYPGLEVVRSSKGLFINQTKYILDLLQSQNLLDCKPVIAYGPA